MAELESKLSRSTLVLIVNVCLLLKDENKCRVCSFVHLLLKTSFYIKLYSTISIQECVGNRIAKQIIVDVNRASSGVYFFIYHSIINNRYKTDGRQRIPS